MKKKLRILISVMTAALLLCAAAVSYGGTSDQIKQKKAQLEQGQQQEANISAQITRLESKITEKESTIASIKSQIADTESSITRVSAQVRQKKASLDKGTDDLNSRLRNMYKSGSVGFVDVILSSSNVSELLNNVEMIKKIYASDREVVAQLQNKYDKIRKKEDQLKAMKAALSEKRANLSSQESALKEDRASLAEKKSAVASNNSQLQNEIDDLQQEADAVTDKIGNYDNGGSYSGGSMCWPVNGTVTCGYGWRICPIHGREFHTGIDIGAAMGQTVRAAAAGTVRQAGPNGGYGNSVIITHGGGITTLYGHNSYVSVSPGQKVRKGQKIAGAGSTGNSTGPHCHFEVRVNGNYVNPMNYL